MIRQYGNIICTILADDAAATSYEAAGLAAGRTYSYIVRAYVGGVRLTSSARA